MASSTQIAQMRRLLYGGSTKTGSLSTDDVAWFFDNNVNLYLGAAQAANAEALVKAAQGDRKVGDLEISFAGAGGGVDFYTKLSKELRLRGVRQVKPFSGGISVDAKVAAEADSDWDRPESRRGQFDYNGGSTGATL